MKFRVLSLLVLTFFSISCTNTDAKKSDTLVAGNDSLIFAEEVHFKSIRQITFGGDNAEAYWSFDDQQLIFQSNNNEWGVECDQMFLMNINENFAGPDLNVYEGQVGGARRRRRRRVSRRSNVRRSARRTVRRSARRRSSVRRSVRRSSVRRSSRRSSVRRSARRSRIRRRVSRN